VPEYLMADMNHREYLIGLAAGRLIASQLLDAGGLTVDAVPIAAQCFARTTAILSPGPLSITKKLVLCAQAAQYAEAAGPPALRCLLMADVAACYAHLGARQKVLDLVHRLASDILDGSDGRLAVYIAVQHVPAGHGVAVTSSAIIALGQALGRCVEALMRSGAETESLELIWRARVLRTDGVYNVLAHIPAELHQTHSFEYEWFQTADEQAYNLFPRGGHQGWNAPAVP
jgi:hypothetical protein